MAHACENITFPASSKVYSVFECIMLFHIKWCNWWLLITARVAKRAKVMFSQASVFLSLNRGVKGQTPPPGQGQRSSTSPGQGQSSSTPPPARVKGQAPSPRPIYGYYGRTVRILLECILVRRNDRMYVHWNRVPTWTRKPGEMGRHFPVRQFRKVRINHTKYWENHWISDKYYLLFLVIFKRDLCILFVKWVKFSVF